MSLNPSSTFTRKVFGNEGLLAILVIIIFIIAIYIGKGYQAGYPQCDPRTAEESLKNLSSRGVHGTNHPPSLSNLLWIHVGPTWFTLTRPEKIAIDKIVRCAARTINDEGQPTWQAAYYDYKTGKLIALTSKEYGFRIQNP